MCCELICLTLIVLGVLFCFCFCFWVSCNVLLNLSSVKDVGKEIWLFKRNCYCVPIILQCILRIVHITNDWKVKKYIINWFDSSCWEYKGTEMNVFTFFCMIKYSVLVEKLWYRKRYYVLLGIYNPWHMTQTMSGILLSLLFHLLLFQQNIFQFIYLCIIVLCPHAYLDAYKRVYMSMCMWRIAIYVGIF